MAARRRKPRVVSLFGGALPIPQVNEDVVGRVGELLAEAKDGQIAGLAYVKVSPEGHFVTSWVGNAGSHDMVAGVAVLARRITKANSE